jgi:hypothetical protein
LGGFYNRPREGVRKRAYNRHLSAHKIVQLSEQSQLCFRPILETVKSVFPLFETQNETLLPSCSQLNKGFNQINLNKKNLQFIQQTDDMPFLEMGYEQRIYLEGLIATRRHNWHDFFNAMVWHTFPKIKSAINGVHYREILKQSSSQRSRKRDLLTLFDESGAIILANQPILHFIQEHQWQSLFIDHRNSWLNGDIQIITFGHALYEKYLDPYIGMTAQTLLLEKDPLSDNCLADVDKKLSDALLTDKYLNNKKSLSPLPLLGIPNWYLNQGLDFYNNTHYFR